MLIINGILDDILLSCINNDYIKSKKEDLYVNKDPIGM